MNLRDSDRVWRPAGHVAAFVALIGCVMPVFATEDTTALHAQATYVEQDSNGFSAPYGGANSLSANSGRETVDVTLYAGVRLWSGGEFWATPEIDQGFGLDDTLGVAGFPSGEAYKVGRKAPYLRLPRAFVRQTLDLGGDPEDASAGLTQFGGTHRRDRWVFTVGKFGVTDVFDASTYAHDPRSDFLNWSAVDAGTFDYAADAWGFTIGAAAERYSGPWTLRMGAFDLSDVPNSPRLEAGFREFQLLGEVERRYELSSHSGRVLLTGFDTRGRMGRLDQAIALGLATGTTPDPARVRQYRSRLGASLLVEQAVGDGVGLFARLGRAQGDVEAYEFTDIDRSLELGTSIAGKRWRRPDDTVGFAGLVNGISGVRERFLALGGLGILVGDGRLPHPGDERILESYYSLAMATWLHVTLDYQYVRNPAYNRDRGPVSILALRIHLQI